MKTEQAQAAKSIKAELSKKFHGIKFSVKSHGFAGGNSVDVGWERGPSSETVQSIVDKYQYGNFNGMIDLYEYKLDRPKTVGSAKYVMATRTIPKEDFTAMVKSLCQIYGVDYVPEEWQLQIGGEYVTSMVHRIMNKRDIPTGYKITGIEIVEGACGLVEDVYKPLFEKGV